MAVYSSGFISAKLAYSLELRLALNFELIYENLPLKSVCFCHNVLDNKGSRSYYNQARHLSPIVTTRRGASMQKQLVFQLLVVLFFTGCVSQSTYDLKSREAASLSAKTEDLEAQLEDLSTQLDNMKKEREALRKDKETLQRDKDILEKEKATLQKEQEGIFRENTALGETLAELSEKAEKAEQLEKTTQTYQDLTQKLEKEIQEGQVQITEMKNRLTMTMVDKILFPSGSAVVSKAGKKVLDKVVSILKDVKDKRIQIEGHTDNMKIVSTLRATFPTNWELSTARATEVLRYLQERGGIDPHLLSATGYGEYQPVTPNDTDEGRHKNRRIEIVLLPLLK
jgi:chemotaxis protein MotB